MRNDAATVTARAEARGTAPAGAGPTLRRLFQTLDEAGIPYCVLHGYEGLPDRVSSDVDCVVLADVLPHRLAAVLRADQDRLRARVVQWFQDAAHFVVLAGREPDGRPFFVQLHAAADYELGRHTLYEGAEVLRGRGRHDGFWVPAPATEFVATLARRAAKGRIDDRQAGALAALYRRDPSGCRRESTRLWGGDHGPRVVAAVEDADWEWLHGALVSLRTAQNLRGLRSRPLRFARSFAAAVGRRVRRWRRADRGLSVVLLGPDGSGKSSVVESLRHDLSPAFVASQRRTFPPGLLRRRGGTNATPHAQRPRSFAHSCVRAACYWLPYCAVVHPLLLRPALAGGTLVLHDRHLADALVDPKRYRYGGPGWLLRVIWRLVPKPDLVILLDAPAEVVQARKREVPLEETRRQLGAYRALVSAMKNGHVVDASRPLAEVVAAVEGVILDCLARRAARQLGLEARR